MVGIDSRSLYKMFLSEKGKTEALGGKLVKVHSGFRCKNINKTQTCYYKYKG